MREYVSVGSQHIPGRGLVLMIDVPADTTPKDLPEVGRVIKVDKEIYRLRGVEYGESGGKVQGQVMGFQVRELTAEEKAFRAGFLCREFVDQGAFAHPEAYGFVFGSPRNPFRKVLVDYAWEAYSKSQ